MKPIPTTLKPQRSVDLVKGTTKEIVYERSDICPVPRAVDVIEGMIAFVIAQALLEKTGGDSISEILPRFHLLKQNSLNDFQLNSERKVWWS
jgi:chorismate synthase